MPQKAPNNALRDAFNTLVAEDLESIKKAKKEIEYLGNQNRDIFNENRDLIFSYIEKFDSIQNVNNQAALISSLHNAYLSLADEYFDLLKNFTLKVIQHPSGKVRQAMVHTADWLYISLTSRIDGYHVRHEKSHNREEQKVAKEQFKNYIKEIEALLDKYSFQDTTSGECIDEMKPTVYKSLQLLWSNVTRGYTYGEIIEGESLLKISPEIIEKRKEIEQEVKSLLKQSKSFYKFEDVKQVVFDENSTDDMQELVKMFDTGKGNFELDTIIEIIQEVWNYFPHRLLDGKSPIELMNSHIGNFSSPTMLQHISDKNGQKIIWNDIFGLVEEESIWEKDNLIATKAGGMGNMLRYYIILVPVSKLPSQKYERNKIMNVLEEAIKSKESLPEEMFVCDEYSLVTILVPFDIAVLEVIENMIMNVNLTKGMLKKDHFVTNINKPSLIQIEEYLKSLKNNGL